MNYYLSASNTKALKGIMAVAILLSHIYTSGNFRFENPALAFLFGSVLGYVPVSVFFFLSGYGLMFSYRTKGQKYIQDFPRNRILSLYFYCVCMILFYTFLRIALQEKINWLSLLKSFTLGGTVIQYGWYLQTILVLYVVFWVCFSIKMKDSHKVGALCGSLLGLYLCAYCFSVTPTWYATAPCMLLGMLWQIHGEKIDQIIHTGFRKWMGIFLSLMLCVVIKVIASFLPTDVSYVVQVTGTAVFFVIAIILWLKGISLVSPITTYLGKISLELYVFQGAIIMILQKLNITNVFLYAVLVLAGTLIIASAAHPLLKKINVITKGRKKLCV